MAEEEKKTCFIIMPITTPEPFREQYRDGAQHFKHVLECLFVPSVELAGYSPIPPIAKGSDLIHAEIVRNLETSDLVLCDMSCLNPNVFFEFGIRTSLNKPVCVVKDELLAKVPFDATMLNYHQYSSALGTWEGTEIRRLADHLKVSAERSKGENTLWRHFALRSEAKPYEGDTGPGAKLDYLTLQIDSLQQQLAALRALPTRYTALSGAGDVDSESEWSRLQKAAREIRGRVGVNMSDIGLVPGADIIEVEYTGEPDAQTGREIRQITDDMMNKYGVRVVWVKSQREPQQR